MIAGGLLPFTRFCMATSGPSAHAATTMAAPGAAALAHSASRIDSSSSPLIPGGVQLLAPVGGAGCCAVNVPEVYAESPKVLRKVTQSARLYKSLSSSTTTVCPEPVSP